MAVAQPLDFEIVFAINPISGSAASFFIIFVKFIFTAIFEIKNHVKNSLILSRRKKRKKSKMAAQRPYRQRRQYLTPTAWELTLKTRRSTGGTVTLLLYEI